MIVQSLLDPVFNILNSLINRIPQGDYNLPDVSTFSDILGYGAYFFPMDTFGQAIALMLFWYAALLTWAVIEWVYKKIPGVS